MSISLVPSVSINIVDRVFPYSLNFVKFCFANSFNGDIIIICLNSFDII